jgi:outer membrane protein TolC
MNASRHATAAAIRAAAGAVALLATWVAGAQSAAVPPADRAGSPIASEQTGAGPMRVQVPPVAGSVEQGLQQLVDEALAANLELSASDAAVRQRLAALDQARARYLPVVDFAARYSVADGGRTIEFPVGDLLNPVYATLDQILVSQGKPPQFPRVRNETIEFLRDREQETKLVVAQPIYEPRIGPAIDANRARLASSEADRAALRGQVVRDVKQAYYRWLALQQAVVVLDATLDATRANLAANESLYRNGKVTRDLVFRAEADVLEIEQERLATDSRVRIARSYVNLLRNAPLDRPLPPAEIDAQTVERFRTILLQGLAGRRLESARLQELAGERRQELRSLDSAIDASLAQQDLARAAFRPTLGFGAEAGYQGEDYGFGQDEEYVLASLVLRWNAYRGGADQAALREARALTDQLRAARDLAGQRVALEVQQAVENFEVAEASLETAAKRAQAAQGAFDITSRKRDLGQVSQAEFIDARRANTDAQLNVTRVRAEYLARLAELEFAVGDTRRPAPERFP